MDNYTPESPNNDYYHRDYPRRSGAFKAFLFALIGAVVGSFLTAYFMPAIIENNIIQPPPGGQSPIIIEPGQDISIVPAVAQKATPAVVGVTTVTLQRDRYFGFLRRGEGVGSGFIVHSDGYILTNDHVINSGQAEKITVLFNDGTEKDAKVLWNSSALDMAVLKVDAKNLPVADLGDSDKLTVGEIAVAIGNPLGLDFQRSVTSGVISGLHRTIQASQTELMEDLIQTDASINPGNSGGPLLNARGEVIGMNTAKISSSVAEGLGFAIPINQAKPIVEQIIEEGKYTMVYLGITPIDVQAVRRQYNVNMTTEEGVYVFEVEKDTPADRAGISAGDIITALNDKGINGRSQLMRELHKYKPGDTITVTYYRGRTENEVEVTLVARPEGQ
ncbi:MAG: trypsin-like peptidase domain-containing protein [Bacillota bacterium]|jgi:S1-C subfamily serine protease|nr:trypsin-like peptidase domain-containing protein [Bacillota bacterium]MDD3851530.1 trypsin-like peptidase domain-containing protein [Bacillota bacterium]MDD4708266.1 trypsin-like peptidase domain-containing protein [Bacillota bacterium]